MNRLAVSALILIGFAATLGAETRTDVPGMNGGMMTFVADDCGQITRIENSDGTVETFDLLADGTDIGMTVHVSKTLELHVRYDYEPSSRLQSMIAAKGMPVVGLVPREDGRTSSVQDDRGQVLALLQYADTGHLTEITLGDRMSLHLSAPDAKGQVVETLYGPAGNLLRTTSADGQWGKNSIASMLDVVATELGIGEGWSQTLAAADSPSNHLTTLTRADGSVALYLVQAGQYTVGFTPEGSAILYDLRVELTGTPIPEGADTVSDPSTDLMAVAPTHVVVTKSGMTGMWVEDTSDRAIHSAWTDRDGSGRIRVRYALAERTAP
jgi:hypothetical protein